MVWTIEQEEKLIKYVKDGYNWTYMGVKFGRSADSVSKHWRTKVRYTEAARGIEYGGPHQ